MKRKYCEISDGDYDMLEKLCVSVLGYMPGLKDIEEDIEEDIDEELEKLMDIYRLYEDKC
jgi:hypothetical protein